MLSLIVAMFNISYAKKTERERDVINLLVLIFIAAALGVYMIATTVVISKDGVYYIERAQEFTSDPDKAIGTHQPGYPLLIFATHEVTTIFAGDLSLFGWIYCAQGVTLLFRLLGLIPLYFVGKWLVGGRKSFCAMLILILLPHPAKMSCEVLREWPYVCILALGFLCLLRGAGRGKCWMFGLAGLSAGLGCWIRPECAQLVIYGLLWLALCMLWPKVGKMDRTRSLAALGLLLVGFTAPMLPYRKHTGSFISPSIRRVLKVSCLNTAPHEVEVREDNADVVNLNMAKIVPYDVAKALGEIFRTVGENLMWFFVPPLLVGLYYRLRHETGKEARFFITFFVLMNLGLMVCFHCCILPHVSNRWSLPLVAFTIYYICEGLQVIECWLGNMRRGETFKETRPRLSLILLLIGIIICLPKLIRPAGADKRGFRTAATWLKNNTGREDIVAVPDRRISFYAERKEISYSTEVPEGVAYVVKIMKDEDEEMQIDGFGRKEFSARMEKRKKNNKRVVIYRIM
ncbi:MAG: ArnT family glycosyltransferase [Planctomycetota bacterium]